jgi:hypothetical protein
MPIAHRVLARDLIGDMGIVCCLESVSGHGFIATNLFVRDASYGGWCIITPDRSPAPCR